MATIEQVHGEGLLAWTLGAFQASVFVLVAFFALHLGGTLGETLERLDTLAGIGLFLLLWLTTAFCTNRGLRSLTLAKAIATPDAAIGYGALWGGVNGAAFFISVVVGLVLVGVVAGEVTGSEILTRGPVFVVFVGFASIVAAFVGAAIGTLFGLIATLVLYVVRRLLAIRPVSAESLPTA